MFNDNLITHLRKEYHKFWYNLTKTLELPNSMLQVLKTSVEFQSRKYYDTDIKELIEAGELT